MASLIKKEFDKKIKGLEEYVLLATVAAKHYQKINIEIIKHMTEVEKIPGVYVTLAKPYKSVKKILEDNEIDTRVIIFIDAVTMITDNDEKRTQDCLFIGSPEKLSDISIAMDQAVTALKSDKKFVFFDSLNTLTLYNKDQTVAKFIHFLSTKMRSWKVKGIIISLEKENKHLIALLSQFCDVILEIKNGK